MVVENTTAHDYEGQRQRANGGSTLLAFIRAAGEHREYRRILASRAETMTPSLGAGILFFAPLI
jgi:hypothetical protein